MKILVVGSGGREHALIWRLKQESPDAQIYAAPGNGGTKALAESVALKPDEMELLADFADSRDVDLTVVGPEAPLVDGIADLFEARGLRIFGPSRAAAEIEGSKAFAKALMQKTGVPTAAHRAFDSYPQAETYIRKRGAPLVVKASGLAAGKGSIICRRIDDALAAARSMLVENEFGDAGLTVVVEDMLEGEELSILYITDGVNALPLIPSQDHKPIGEGDTGPNTGGMGAYSPVSIASPPLIERVTEQVVHPTLREMREQGRTFRGVLYCGLMIAAGKPYVIEFNCRFGDPETQAIVPLFEGSLLELFQRIAAGGKLAPEPLRWKPGAAVCTVLASRGYPDHYEKGKVIKIPEELSNDTSVLLFHAGTRRNPEGKLLTDGGRVLGVAALGASAVSFAGKYFRSDIGFREIERETST
jgi:phosphoribosylamine--glycine ligase